jgi:putative ABC transport system permease protein
MAWRESRSQRGRLLLFSFSIVLGIASLVAIHSLKARLEAGIRAQANALLGSDLQVSSRQPFPADAVAFMQARAKSVRRETSFSSMLYFAKADAARLVQVRGVEPDYPFYGTLETDPPEAWRRMHSGVGIVLEPALLDQFGVSVGDRVKLGNLELPILGSFKKGSARSSRFGGFSPQVFISYSLLDQTGLLGTNSLVSHLLHMELSGAGSLPAGASPGDSLARDLRKQFPDGRWQFETPESRRDSLGNSLEQLEEFLGLLALVALVLGAIGVAAAIHAHVSLRLQSIAILRCLGCPASTAFSIYLAQALVLVAGGALLGTVLGLGFQHAVAWGFARSLPVALPPAPAWTVVAQTTLAGFAVCMGFAVMPLLRIRGVPPTVALRAAVEPQRPLLARPAGAFWAVGLMGLLWGLTVLHGTPLRRAAILVAGLACVFALLFSAAAAGAALARRLPRPSWPYVVRQGVSNLFRPQNQTLLFLLSLGLGTCLLLTVLFVRGTLLESLKPGDLQQSPNIYLVDVQEDQRAGVEALLKELHLPVLESAPIVTMRIASVKGVPVRELEQQAEARAKAAQKAGESPKGTPRWVLQREYRSSYRAELTGSEQLAEGAWFSEIPWAPGTEPVPVSLESKIARDLELGIGDELGLDVQGVPVRARVANLRKVDWSRFNLNFFMIFPQGVLEAAPGFTVLTTRIPKDTSSGALQRTLVRQFPNVSAIDLTLILETVSGILAQMSRVVEVLAGVTVLAGIPILSGCLLNGRSQRLRESVLLRTLGASRRQVRSIFLVEYACLGTLSAVAGVLLAVVAHAALAHFLFKTAPRPDPGILLAGLLLPPLLSLAAGAWFSRGVCAPAPMEILRENS